MFLRNCRTAKFGYVLSNDPFCTVRWVSPMTRPKQVPPRPHLLSYWPKTNSLNTTGKCVLLLDFISITFVDCRPAACKQHRQGGPVLYVYTARGWRANVFSFFFFSCVWCVQKQRLPAEWRALNYKMEWMSRRRSNCTGNVPQRHEYNHILFTCPIGLFLCR